jgi:hypothetical protein
MTDLLDRLKSRSAATAEREVNPLLWKEMPQTYEDVFRRALARKLGRRKLPAEILDGAAGMSGTQYPAD